MAKPIICVLPIISVHICSSNKTEQAVHTVICLTMKRQSKFLWIVSKQMLSINLHSGNFKKEWVGGFQASAFTNSY